MGSRRANASVPPYQCRDYIMPLRPAVGAPSIYSCRASPAKALRSTDRPVRVTYPYNCLPLPRASTSKPSSLLLASRGQRHSRVACNWPTACGPEETGTRRRKTSAWCSYCDVHILVFISWCSYRGAEETGNLPEENLNQVDAA